MLGSMDVMIAQGGLVIEISRKGNFPQFIYGDVAGYYLSARNFSKAFVFR